MYKVGYELEFFLGKGCAVQVPCTRAFYDYLDAGRILVEARGDAMPHPCGRR